MNKVFGIGLSHTGTKSLNRALQVLGIQSVHYPLDPVTYRELSESKYRLTILNTFEAITDITVAPFYPQLDKAYPGSKFILTIREKSDWINSMKKRNVFWLRYANQGFFIKYWRTVQDDWKTYGGRAFRSTWFAMRRERIKEFYRISTYGALAFHDLERLSYAYDIHCKNVTEYFRNRNEDLLILDITMGEGWEKLCPFLSKPVPDCPFPHLYGKKFHPEKSQTRK